MGRLTLIDDLVVAKRKQMMGWIPDQKELAAAQAFRIDNVDEYLHQHVTDYPSLESFPNLAPPFSNFFMMSERSTMLLEEGVRNCDRWPQKRYGVWFLSTPIEQATNDVAISLFGQLGTNRLILKKRGARWFMHGLVFEHTERRAPIVGFALWSTVITEDGTIMPGISEWRFPSDVVSLLARAYRWDEEHTQDNMMQTGIMYVAACALAISLSHCKNVAAIEPEETPADRYRREEFERKNRTPAARWKVLNISPMQRVIRDEGQIESKGMIQALHICRGHFKDYREKGLFGKNKGVYWWGQQMRGNESAGVIIKDYSVQPTSDNDLLSDTEEK